MEDQLVDIGNLFLENNSSLDELAVGFLTFAGMKASNYQYKETKQRTEEAFVMVPNERFKELFERPRSPESVSEKAVYYAGRFLSPEFNGRMDAIREKYEQINIEEAQTNHAYGEGIKTEIDYSSI